MDTTHYELRIYIAGMTPAANRAIKNLNKICRTLEEGSSYDIEVIDIFERPQLAESEKILATPTVVRVLPEPIKKLIGDLSDKEMTIIGLDLEIAE